MHFVVVADFEPASLIPMYSQSFLHLWCNSIHNCENDEIHPVEQPLHWRFHTYRVNFTLVWKRCLSGFANSHRRYSRKGYNLAVDLITGVNYAGLHTDTFTPNFFTGVNTSALILRILSLCTFGGSSLGGFRYCLS